MYADGNFFQIIEGPKDDVLAVFDKINKDPRHYNILKVVDNEISHGSLDGYKVDIIGEAQRYDYEVPLQYYEALRGIPDCVRKPMERML